MSTGNDSEQPVDRFPKCAVVTGAGGFIGSYVARHLAANGCIVRGIGHSEISEQDLAALSLSEWHSGGISTSALSKAARNAEVIFHCAGSGSVPLSLREPMVDFQKNVESTNIVLNFSKENDKIPVIYLSSAGVYGNAKTIPIPPSAPCDPISPYGMNKRIGEMLVDQYARFFDVPGAIVRLFSVYGDGLRKQLLWDASHKLLTGDMMFFGTGEEVRDWIHVEDAARLIVRLWSHASIDVPIHNGGCGDNVSNSWLLTELARCFEVAEPVAFNGNVRPGDPKAFIADVSASYNIGWSPEVRLEDGLKSYARWFQKTTHPN